MSSLELLAVVCSVLYLILASLEKRSCWSFAGLSVILYMVILSEVKLYSEVILQFYYLIMAGYGYYSWSQAGSSTAIKRMSRRLHVLMIGLTFGLTLVLGYAMAVFTEASMPYVDAFTTVGAVFTTWLVAKKYLENWLYWIVIDTVGVWLYWQKSLCLTSLLFILYVVLAIIGMLNWKRRIRCQETELERDDL